MGWRIRRRLGIRDLNRSRQSPLTANLATPPIMNKPVVYFRGPIDQVAGRAILTPINHPSPLVSNTKTILTSKVLWWHNDRIETENTIYVRID